ncbi:hypothetical protein D1AOALGA4SA_5093 [Olavius algarvensis Delta 1 endosymbiont]|nr:hypothetical protein D1AOALGA4SA_5093 [Olavius algarvensis Delta 1 endosymbiont]
MSERRPQPEFANLVLKNGKIITLGAARPLTSHRSIWRPSGWGGFDDGETG